MIIEDDDEMSLEYEPQVPPIPKKNTLLEIPNPQKNLGYTDDLRNP